MSTTPATTTTPAPKKKGAMRFITPALALVAVLGIGIFTGVLIGQNSNSSATQAGGAGGFGGDSSEMTQGGASAMGGFTSGTVVSVDGDTVVVEAEDGTQTTVTTTDDTTVTASTDSTVDALAAGDTVTVIGETDDSGDVAATSISEGETTGFGGGMGGGTAPTGDAPAAE